MVEQSETVRIDKWLWFARFFKTRALATEAVRAGHVEVNQVRAKPGKAVRAGDALLIRKGPYEFEVEIVACGHRRESAELARALYTESEESRTRRAEIAQKRRDERTFAAAPIAPPTKPDKRERRQLEKLRRGDGTGGASGSL